MLEEQPISRDESTDDSKPWMAYAGMVESGEPDSSLRIDEIAYATGP
jgi:hypothetical protein